MWNLQGFFFLSLLGLSSQPPATPTKESGAWEEQLDQLSPHPQFIALPTGFG